MLIYKCLLCISINIYIHTQNSFSVKRLIRKWVCFWYHAKLQQKLAPQ